MLYIILALATYFGARAIYSFGVATLNFILQGYYWLPRGRR